MLLFPYVVWREKLPDNRTTLQTPDMPLLSFIRHVPASLALTAVYKVTAELAKIYGKGYVWTRFVGTKDKFA
jgi:hypothetical protein